MRRLACLALAALALFGALLSAWNEEEAEARPKPPNGPAKPHVSRPEDAGTPRPDASVRADAAALSVVSVGDGGVRTFQFRELEIEGRRKGPEDVILLKRVRAEFGPRPLPHRSFAAERDESGALVDGLR